MRIVDMRAPAGGTRWETDTLESYTEVRWLAGEVTVKTSHGYEIEFNDRDIQMLRKVVREFDAHPPVVGGPQREV